MQPKERYRIAKRITLIGAVMNALLGIIKTIGGILFHSHGLTADGLHSFSDLLIDAMVLVASKYGGQHTDDAHPYGHQRIETAATFFLAMLLIITGVVIAWHSFTELKQGLYTIPKPIALIIITFSILINEGLFHWTRYVGTRIQSDLLIANAWHHRSDAASSLVVFIGLLGDLAGFAYLDSIAAIIVGIMIIHMGATYGWNSIKELIDTAVNPEQLAAIETTIMHIDGVKKIHQLRSRMMGRDVFVDVHVLVSPFISVSEGHYIAQHVHYKLTHAFPDIKDVTVHIDPEDDETNAPSLHLPTRATLEHKILRPWQKEYPALQEWLIHYLEGNITLDLICTSTLDMDAFSAHAHASLQQHSPLIHLRLFTIQKG